MICIYNIAQVRNDCLCWLNIGDYLVLKMNTTTCRCGLDNVPIEAISEYVELDHNGKPHIIYLCPCCMDCIHEIENENNKRQVTREMAIDAGDIRLEGQWIKF